MPSDAAGRYAGQIRHDGVVRRRSGFSALRPRESHDSGLDLPDPLRGCESQAVIARWSPERNAGYALVLEPEGDVALWLGDGSTVRRIRTGIPVHAGPWYARDWFFVSGTFDAAAGIASVRQAPVAFWPLHPGDASLSLRRCRSPCPIRATCRSCSLRQAASRRSPTTSTGSSTAPASSRPRSPTRRSSPCATEPTRTRSTEGSSQPGISHMSTPPISPSTRGPPHSTRVFATSLDAH